VTLLEALIYCVLWAILAVATMRVLGDARILRSNARDRSVMALIAQSEIERVSSLPAEALTEGATTLQREEWPTDVTAMLDLERRDDGTWLIDIRVERDSVEGKPSVHLTTIRTGEPAS